MKQSAIGAAALIEAAAEKGNPEECYAMGWMYEYNVYLPADLVSFQRFITRSSYFIPPNLVGKCCQHVSESSR